jgi:uncharacterized DUF497 family protein
MIDWTGVQRFERNDGNARNGDDKRGVSQLDAAQVLLKQPLLVMENLRHSPCEPRFHALARTDEVRLLHVTFTLRSTATRISVISARDMSQGESRLCAGVGRRRRTGGTRSAVHVQLEASWSPCPDERRPGRIVHDRDRT